MDPSTNQEVQYDETGQPTGWVRGPEPLGSIPWEMWNEKTGAHGIVAEACDA